MSLVHYECILCHQSAQSALCIFCQDALAKEALTNKRKIIKVQGETIFIYSFNHYDGNTKKLLSMFKYNKNHLAGKALASYFYQTCQQQHALSDIDLILPVPSHRLRYLYRGFNQAEILAKSLYDHDRNHYDARALIKARYTRPQAKSNYTQRQTQLHGTIAQRHVIVSKHLLIVDDVITTGATIQAMIKTLLNNPNNKIDRISVASLCRA
ncbi:ComF family protein [Facilibium subflavum]|uniref:ComF family protein n=1 Tax=Facilibium subflavum TaxID=2219058 RepID=UPI001AACDD60|nr:phosphoribosyltransferase family protein [Facilibium subflavum]